MELYLAFREYESKQLEEDTLQKLVVKYIQDGGILTEYLTTNIQMVISEFNRIKHTYLFTKDQYIREQMMSGLPSLLDTPPPPPPPPKAAPRRFLPLGNGTFGIYKYPLSYY